MKLNYEEIVAAFDARKSPREIAAQFECSTQSVYRILQRPEYARLKKTRQFSPREERFARAKALIEEGYSPKAAGEMVHLRHGAVLKRFPEYRFTREQTNEASAMGRELARLGRAA